MKSIYGYVKQDFSDSVITEYLLNDIDQNIFDYDSRFWIEAVTNVNIKGEIKVSEDGNNWKSVKSYSLNSGEFIYMYAVDNPSNISYRGRFNIGGDINGLLSEDCERNKRSLMFAFRKSDVVDASDLNMEYYDIIYSNSCISMFENCESLEKAPKLPSTRVTEYGYSDMFSGCISLREAPDLPATQLEPNCYSGMFNRCTSLKEAPKLPAMKLANMCYRNMFRGCRSLKKTPDLPATQIADSCYNYMFADCTSLTSIPKILPATQLAEDCYNCMFINCALITQAPELPATQLTNDCYKSMFQGCLSLKKAPKLPATDLAEDCYSEIFKGCGQINYVEIYADPKYDDWSHYGFRWLRDCAREGVIKKSADLYIKSGNLPLDAIIPKDWKIEDL